MQLFGNDLPRIHLTLLPGNHMFPRWTNTNPLNLDAHKLLDKLNILPRLDWQIIKARSARSRLLPARHRLVVHLHLT